MNILKGAAVLLACIVALFLCLTCCVLPCLKAMIHRLVKQATNLYFTQTSQYAEVPLDNNQEDPESSGNEEEEDDENLRLSDLFLYPGDYRKTVV